MSTFVFCGATCNKSSVASVAIKTENTIIITVDTGMKGWAMYVNAGNATQAQVDAVKNAYNTYYAAQSLADIALTDYIASGSTNSVSLNTINSQVATAETALLSLLNTYIK